MSNYNFNGGPRDFMVPSHISNFDKFETSINNNFLSMGTLQVKNVYQSLTHNSFLDDKTFLNMLTPLVINDFVSKGSSQERVEETQK